MKVPAKEPIQAPENDIADIDNYELKHDFQIFGEVMITDNRAQRARNFNVNEFYDTLDVLQTFWEQIVDDESDIINHLIKQAKTAEKVVIVDTLNIIGNDKLDEIKKLALDAAPPTDKLRKSYREYLTSVMSVSTTRLEMNCVQQLEYLTVIANLMNKFGKKDNLYIFVVRKDITTEIADSNCQMEDGFHQITLFPEINNLWVFIVPGEAGSEVDDIMLLFLSYIFKKYSTDNVGILSSDKYNWTRWAHPDLQELFRNRIVWRLIQLGDGTIVDVETLLSDSYRPIQFILD